MNNSEIIVQFVQCYRYWKLTHLFLLLTKIIHQPMLGFFNTIRKSFTDFNFIRPTFLLNWPILIFIMNIFVKIYQHINNDNLFHFPISTTSAYFFYFIDLFLISFVHFNPIQLNQSHKFLYSESYTIIGNDYPKTFGHFFQQYFFFPWIFQILVIIFVLECKKMKLAFCNIGI